MSNKRAANSVISTITIPRTKPISLTPSTSTVLQLHAGNCAGQNKNVFFQRYLIPRVLLGLERDVELNFLVAGHTKNVWVGHSALSNDVCSLLIYVAQPR